MQESVSMQKKAKKPYPTQAFMHESSKVGGRGKRDRKDRGQEAVGQKGSPTKQKHIGRTKTRMRAVQHKSVPHHSSINPMPLLIKKIVQLIQKMIPTFEKCFTLVCS